MRSTTRGEAGFVVIELPIVVTIIAILINLLLPAIQRVREAAAGGTCSTERLELVGELDVKVIAHPQLGKFEFTVNAGNGVFGIGDETGNEWRLVGSSTGSADLDTPAALLHGFKLVGASDDVAGAVVPISVQAVFVFDKDLTLLGTEIPEAVAEDPCS